MTVEMTDPVGPIALICMAKMLINCRSDRGQSTGHDIRYLEQIPELHDRKENKLFGKFSKSTGTSNRQDVDSFQLRASHERSAPVMDRRNSLSPSLLLPCEFLRRLYARTVVETPIAQRRRLPQLLEQIRNHFVLLPDRPCAVVARKRTAEDRLPLRSIFVVMISSVTSCLILLKSNR